MKIAAWVGTGYPAAFPYTSMPAYTAFPLVPCLFYARGWTLGLALVCTLVVWYMTKKGHTIFWIYNRLKGRLHGNRLAARPVWFIRRFAHVSGASREA